MFLFKKNEIRSCPTKRHQLERGDESAILVSRQDLAPALLGLVGREREITLYLDGMEERAKMYLMCFERFGVFQDQSHLKGLVSSHFRSLYHILDYCRAVINYTRYG